jgi:hypothetical protein
MTHFSLVFFVRYIIPLSFDFSFGCAFHDFDFGEGEVCGKGFQPHAAGGVKGFHPHAAGHVKLPPSPRSYGGTGRHAADLKKIFTNSINPGWHDFECAPERRRRQEKLSVARGEVWEIGNALHFIRADRPVVKAMMPAAARIPLTWAPLSAG